MMMSSNDSEGELADQLALPRRLDLEAAERLRAPDQLVRRRVVPRHLGLVLDVDVHPVDPGHLSDRMRHRRLHPDPEHVELEQPEVLDVLLVELAHRVAEEARLDRGAVEQRGVGQQHAARMHGDVPRQPVELLDQREEQVEAGLPASRIDRSSGSSCMAMRASRARMCGNALAIWSISPDGMPSAAPTSRIACRTR